VQAKSRVLETICTGIRERYKALSLPPELALPEPESVDVVADMTHPDQRAIGAAGRKVLAMFETISQFCQKAQQVILSSTPDSALASDTSHIFVTSHHPVLT